MLPLASPTKYSDLSQVFHLSQLQSLHLLTKIKMLGGSNEVMSIKALEHVVYSLLGSSGVIVHYWRAQKIVTFSCSRCWKPRDTVMLLHRSPKTLSLVS